ncbi:MAG: histone [Nanoarchaeota archaeon]
MGRKTTLIPKASVARILMKAGAKRVSQDAVDAFTEILIEKALKISSKAAEISKHAGRKTIHEGDIKLASK